MEKKRIFLVSVISVCLFQGSLYAQLPAGWIEQDGWLSGTIGPDVGNAVIAGKTFEITGGGWDIWGASDEGHFLFKEALGDGEIIARCTDVGTGSNSWAKGGIMIRNNLEGDSAHAHALMTGGSGGGGIMQWRSSDGAGNSNWPGSDTTPAVSVPKWLKLERIGDEFSAYFSDDGSNWTQTATTQTIAMTDPVYVGFGVTSHQNGELRTFVYDSLESSWFSFNTATAPLPEDGTDDIPREVVLSWAPSELAQTHDVYLGTVFADVNDRTTPVSQGQDANSFAAGRLEFGQTYFWRVDEVNGAPDHTVFKGEVWSFTTEPFSYPIENITATASSSQADNMGPENTINGVGLNDLDQHSSEGTEMWLSGMGDATPSIQYGFDKAYKLDEMWVWNSNQLIEGFVGLGAKDVVIEHSMDGVEWVVLDGVAQFAQAPGSPTYTANTVVDFGGVLAQQVRITINSGWGMLPQYGLSAVRFLFVPTFAREPLPADGDTTESANVVLGWRAGREAASHEVYLGTDPANLAMLGTAQENKYDAGALDYNTTYYWQIVEVNAAETPATHAGPIWSFATLAFGIVDNFDTYDDNCNRIFFAWEDGLGHNGGTDIDDCDVAPSNGNGGGSIVGNSMAPFAEQTIVYSGTQSLPLIYDNAFGASEAKLSFAAQDWTASGIKTLALSFFGDPDNTGQLYVKINNSKVVYDRDAADIRRTRWQPWNIDLASVGGNLQNVSSLSIGVEGTNAAGIVYIDSIGLYPQAAEFITPQEPDSASLMVHYTFDGNVIDSSGQGVHGEEMGAPAYVAGVDGQAIQLNGIDDYVNLVLDVPENGSTTAFWFNTSNPDCGLYSVVQNLLGGGGNDRNIYLADGDIGIRIWDTEIITAAGSQVADGQWHHVAHTFGDDVGGQRLYIDGLLQASGTKAQSDFDWQERVHFGWTVDAVNAFMEGMIDDARIYNRTLTPAEIAWLAGKREPMPKPF